MECVIETTALTKYYGKHAVVNQLNLKIPPGTVYGFLGRNGAGKSTTIGMLLGFIHPDSGSSKVLGEDSLSLSPAIRSRVAYLAEGHPLYGWMTIREAVALAQPFYPNWNQEFAREALDYFALSEKQKIKSLSRGQRAQVALMLAVAPDPEVLILDDPTLGLDTVVRRDLLESLIELIQRKGRTIFFSSHILNDVERVADRIGILIDGVLRADCPTETFRDSLRRFVLEFPASPPALPEIEGLISSREIGSRIEVVILRCGESQLELLHSLNPVRLEEDPMDLEDTFIEYTRGGRRKLPSFLREGNHVVGLDPKRAA